MTYNILPNYIMQSRKVRIKIHYCGPFAEREASELYLLPVAFVDGDEVGLPVVSFADGSELGLSVGFAADRKVLVINKIHITRLIIKS